MVGAELISGEARLPNPHVMSTLSLRDFRDHQFCRSSQPHSLDRWASPASPSPMLPTPVTSTPTGWRRQATVRCQEDDCRPHMNPKSRAVPMRRQQYGLIAERQARFFLYAWQLFSNCCPDKLLRDVGCAGHGIRDWRPRLWDEEACGGFDCGMWGSLMAQN